MTGYATLPVTVKAFQLTIRNVSRRSSWPDWLQQAEREGRFRVSWDGYPMITEKDGHMEVTAGDWALPDPQGRLFIIPDGAFRTMFAPITELPCDPG